MKCNKLFSHSWQIGKIRRTYEMRNGTMDVEFDWDSSLVLYISRIFFPFVLLFLQTIAHLILCYSLKSNPFAITVFHHIKTLINWETSKRMNEQSKKNIVPVHFAYFIFFQPICSEDFFDHWMVWGGISVNIKMVLC